MAAVGISRGALVAVAAVMAAAVLGTASAATYTVGEPGGSWDLSTNYANWVSSKKFHPRDQIVFKYSPQAHDVLEVNKAAHDSCSTSNAIATHTSGNDTIDLTSTGTRYFICGFPNHCTGGMKIQIDVVPASSSTPAPAGSPTANSPTANSPNGNSPPPPPSKEAEEQGRLSAMAGCCVFLRWPSTSPSRLGYRSLDQDGGELDNGPSPATVTVVVGKERRVFLVDQLMLDTYPFRVLLETVVRKEERRGKAIFIDVDAILFEHILWLACHERSVSLLQLDLKEIIEFYSQDA